MENAIFSIVVPVYNSEKTLELLYSRIKDVFDKREGQDFELILVDDFSKDDSYKVMQTLSKKDERVKAFQLTKNFGQHRAIICGFTMASGDFVITMDDDLQHPPEEIPVLIDELNHREDLDAVIGEYITKRHSLFRRFGTLLAEIVTSIAARKKVTIKLTSFRLMRSFVAKQIASTTVFNPRIGFLLLDTTGRIGNVLVKHNERYYGKSGYTTRRLISDLLGNLYANTDFPLVCIRNLGILSFIISIIGAVYYLIIYLTQQVGVQGWTTLVLIVISFSGIILFSIGIVGEYLMRIFRETKKTPVFILRPDILKPDKDNENKAD